MYTYYQLFDENYNELVKGNDNPANISDGTHGQTAAKMAREWMRKNNVKSAILVQNGLDDRDGDNILSQRDLTV